MHSSIITVAHGDTAVSTRVLCPRALFLIAGVAAFLSAGLVDAQDTAGAARQVPPPTRVDSLVRARRTLLIGIMSMAQDTDRRSVIRRTWMSEARRKARLLTVRFVLGQPSSAAERSAVEGENHTHGDIVMMPCQENQHKGKTLHWFAHAHANAAGLVDYVAKMDQDAYVWPVELQEHMQGFADSAFYGGVKVDVYFENGERNRFTFMNGGFAILSIDLVAEVARVVKRTKTTREGFLDRGRGLRGNEDVVLGRLMKERWRTGRLRLNDGNFPWSSSSHHSLGTSSEYAPGSPEFLLRTCPWRHSKDLKFVSAYERQWKHRDVKGCRCNCPPEYSTEEARAAYAAEELKIRNMRRNNPHLPFSTPEELEEWKTQMKKQQKEIDDKEEQRLLKQKQKRRRRRRQSDEF
eukprot:TRINITY_DN55972_c0_g1_i1.p1 TRINITY_DN55972_c0_g1~~TRINITY_DN55972_c0_g1_i1.p1  ORF type:complete len:407 (+),score=67.61 TRINITY_DN55972_c0_g1_i1:177-1397(+)